VVERSALATAARSTGLPELFVPRSIVRVPAIPLLGSGKVDYVAAAALAARDAQAVDVL
jgi:acyl-[acyl-carrier-protein]-phospholipid O-acyltransferase/long-chain-fatty-acid--[acyl-carrier-protein] ligase